MPKRKAVPASVRRAMAQGVQLPQIAELASHFMTAAGGPKEIARMLLVEFKAAKAGSIIRQRILDSVLRMISQGNEDMGGLVEMDLLSTEDLERELAKLMPEIPEDGQEETAPAAGPAANA